MAGRILIVDSVPTNRITTKVRLTSACYDVTAVGSGAEALRQARLTQPQIVLIGTALHDMTPPALCAALRDLPGGTDLPILVHALEVGARIAALKAGASALIDALGDELTLLARIRGLMRADELEPSGMAEAQAGFMHDDRPRAVFVADQPATALGWRHALQTRLDFSILIRDPEGALADAARGRVPDLYLIAADIQQSGDGLRLLSELRSRPLSRDAGFIIVLRPERSEMTSVALDLGAGDVLPTEFGNAATATEAAFRLETQLSRKREADRRKQETRRNVAFAMTDPLTGLYNRRYAMPRLAALFDASRNNGEAVAVIVMDLDRFKQVNDVHGHAAGDAVLTTIATRLAETLPPEALLARIGGEEFLAVLPGLVARDARAIAEELRECVMETPVPLPAGCSADTLSVTISAGIALADDHMADADILIAHADRALLTAKSSGRNRIVMASSAIAA
ncbi:diguanylate cyclase [Paracoccus sp. DK608]|uniref:diguanylate cyclase n=2 Tax=Paracoccus shanxieyensis TaxID=2675752 RepID=A0A6L6ISH9_9RHOB|nr:diguanylate cyclase [Paracoccus shanxieyensis]MTH86366.1 diguanylate cyclase [Paracoccus shanxieyensis]